MLARSFRFLLGERDFAPEQLARLSNYLSIPGPPNEDKWWDHDDLVAAGVLPHRGRHRSAPYGRGRAFLSHVMESRRAASCASNRSIADFLQRVRIGDLGGCCDASDPRDIIFSLWAYYNLPRYLRPDYTLSTRTVYQRATLTCIEARNDLSVLGMAGGVLTASRDRLMLPTWVPDWTRPSLLLPFMSPQFEEFYNGTNACNSYGHSFTGNRQD